ncbi:hypothetical protein E4T44_06940 [Aureobasidium sp. EXF-8845]|nr:hypothetical protein E4T44_06940 [Aureobasidium sp. EXF-8845]KAI4843934.1 hypothetical protein E4T45_08373 [Aureobasidium sp. EXF-8846]
MPPKNTLSARDIEVVAAAFQCLKTPPDIDWDKLAEKAGYKNGQSARACFQDIKKRLRSTAGDETDTTTFIPPISNISQATLASNTNKKPTVSRKRKQPHSPTSSSATPSSSSPTADSDNETTAPPTKKPKITKATKTKTKTTTASKATRVKEPVISTLETEEDINNAKAIAAGRARYTADKLAAEVKMEEQDERDYPVVGAEERDDAEDAEPMGMNIDEGEDEGPTAYDLVKNEVIGEGVEI